MRSALLILWCLILLVLGAIGGVFFYQSIPRAVSITPTVTDPRFIAPEPYRAWVMQYAAQYGVPLDIAIRLAYEESRWKETAMGKNRNGTYDHNLYQLNSRFHRVSLAQENIRQGLEKLGRCIKMAPDMKTAILYYNAGPNFYKKYGYWPKTSLAMADRIIEGGM